MYTVFIDGQAGTTGLQIHQRLQHIPEVRVIEIAHEERKNPDVKKACMAQSDITILCLHDDHARASVALIDSIPADQRPRIIDASTAHRTHADWVYGFPELCAGQVELITQAERVANPGCYATGAIALIRPLIDAGVLPTDTPLTLPAVSGYSGGGNALIDAFENGSAPLHFLYGLNLNHKHIPEMMHHTGLEAKPLFIPSVGNFAQGMIVQMPLRLEDLKNNVDGNALRKIYRAHYSLSDKTNSHTPCVRVIEADAADKFSALRLNDSNNLDIAVFEYEDQILALARLDNLGKGASGAAVQNLKLMLDI